MKPTIQKSRAGMVLILVLWAVALLSVMAVDIGMSVRQRIELLNRLESRARVHQYAVSGVRLARGFLMNQKKAGAAGRTLQGQKAQIYNNSQIFGRRPLARGYFDVSYASYALGEKDPPRLPGVTDENRRININRAKKDVLTRLIREVLNLKQDEASRLAGAIVDWREYGKSEIVGFYSEAYYDNLEHPYHPKKKPFESLDELRLVKGVTPDIFRRLKPFVTIYGQGAVNINTAPYAVLVALGLSPQTANKIVFGRLGQDRREATADDYVFQGGQISGDFAVSAGLNSSEIQQINALFSRHELTTQSSIFRVVSTGVVEPTGETRRITCVFRGNDGKILYWRENTAQSAEGHAHAR